MLGRIYSYYRSGKFSHGACFSRAEQLTRKFKLTRRYFTFEKLVVVGVVSWHRNAKINYYNANSTM